MNYEELRRVASTKPTIIDFVTRCTEAVLAHEIHGWEFVDLLTEPHSVLHRGGPVTITARELSGFIYALREYLDDRFRRLEDKERELDTLLERAKRRLDEAERLLENIDKHYLSQSGDIQP